MNNYIEENKNTWAYVKCNFWGEDWNGEGQLSGYPISLKELSDYLNGEDVGLSEDGKSISFDLTE